MQVFNHLRNAVLIFILLPLLSLVLALGIVGLQQLQRQIELRLQEDIELIARSLRTPVANAMARGESSAVQEALDSAFQLEPVFGAYVYDIQGRKIATSGPNSPALDHRREARELTAGRSLGTFDERQGREVFSFFTPLSDAGGRLVGLLQVTRDITPLQHYLTKMQILGALALLLLAALFVGVVLLGYQRAVGRHVDRLIKDLQRIDSENETLRLSEQGPEELRRIAQTLNEMLENQNLAEERMTQQREAQRLLEERLQHSEKLAAIGQLAAGVAHQLGTPLSVIRGRAQRAGREIPHTSAATAELRDLLREIHRVETLVQQLLDFARRSPLQKRRIPLANFLEEMVERIRLRPVQKTIRLEVLPALPESAGTLQIAADVARLEQALDNILRNAMDAAQNCVQITYQKIHPHSGGEDLVEIAIQDDGTGLPAGTEEKIFEPFFSTKPAGEGTGLGLAVARAAVSDHDGTLSTDPTVMQGARFILHLPLVGSAS